MRRILQQAIDQRQAKRPIRPSGEPEERIVLAQRIIGKNYLGCHPVVGNPEIVFGEGHIFEHGVRHFLQSVGFVFLGNHSPGINLYLNQPADRAAIDDATGGFTHIFPLAGLSSLLKEIVG